MGNYMVASVRDKQAKRLKILLLLGLTLLYIQLQQLNSANVVSSSEMTLRAEQGHADMSLRVSDFPDTHISVIHVDLTSPNHGVTLTWSGPASSYQRRGPFHSSPGTGRSGCNCNDVAESNRGGSWCTPKGKRVVEAFSDAMPSASLYKFVTWFHSSREIAFHSHPSVPVYPASHGCVRLDEYAAQLIHNNSLAGKTQVIVDGEWMAPATGG